ncbi:unnamed protein product, partial [Larinioides sclopetarius]
MWTHRKLLSMCSLVHKDPSLIANSNETFGHCMKGKMKLLKKRWMQGS